MIAWNDFIAHHRLVHDLYRISRKSGYKPPELLTNYVAWLQYNLPDLSLTDDECIHLIYNFAPAVDRVAERGAA